MSEPIVQELWNTITTLSLTLEEAARVYHEIAHRRGSAEFTDCMMPSCRNWKDVLMSAPRDPVTEPTP